MNAIPQIQLAGIGESLSQVLDSSQPVSIEAQLNQLVNDLSGLEERVVLILDDLHTITETRIHQDLAYLIGHLNLSSGRLHLVVAGWMDPLAAGTLAATR